MRFFFNQALNKLVSFYGSNTALTSAENAKRRDEGRVEIQISASDDITAEAIELSAGYVIVMGLKEVDDWAGPYVVSNLVWTWDATNRLYYAYPSYNTFHMSRLFIGATALNNRTSTAYTLAATDSNKLVTLSNAAAITLTVPLNSVVPLSVGFTAYLLRGDAGVPTVTPATVGVTLTYDTDVVAAMPYNQTYKLVKTATDAWTVSLADEESDISLMLEFSIKASAAVGYLSSQKLTALIENDVIRGDETTPINSEDVDQYYTKVESDALRLIEDVNAQTGTSYTLVIADSGKRVTMSNAAASVLNIPLYATQAIPVGSRIHVLNLGAGAVTLTAAVGVTLLCAQPLLALRQNESAWLKKTATDTWEVKLFIFDDATFFRNDAAQSYNTTRQKLARDNMGLPSNTQTLTDAATIAWDMALGLNAKVTLGGNRTLGAPTNAPFTGASGHLIVTQDGTGNRSLALNAVWVKGYVGNDVVRTAGAVTVLRWHYDGTSYHLTRVVSNKDDQVVSLSGFSEVQVISIKNQLGINILDSVAYVGQSSSSTADLVLGSLTIPANALDSQILIEFEAWGQVSNTAAASNLVNWVKIGGTKYFSVTQALGTTASGGKEWRARGFMSITDFTLAAMKFAGSLDTRWSTTDNLNANYAETSAIDVTSGIAVQIGANVSAGTSVIFQGRGFVRYIRNR